MIYMQCGMKPAGSEQDLMEDAVSTLLLFFAAAGLFFAYTVKCDVVPVTSLTGFCHCEAQNVVILLAMLLIMSDFKP